jgi:arginase
MRLAVIGVPYSSTGLPGGEARAPAVLRAAGLVEMLRAANDVADFGDLPAFSPTPKRDLTSGIIDPETLMAMIDVVRQAVHQARREERLPLVIGGECPLLLGCLAAAREERGQVGLLFVDGHEDAWAPQRSTTGEAADMELGLALGLTQLAGLDRLAAILPLVLPQDTIVIGPRDREEITAAEEPSIASPVTFLDDREVQQLDLASTIVSHTSRLSREPGAWWFHLDLDVLSTEAMPAIRYPQPGGLDWAQAETIAHVALGAPGLIGWDLTIYNPDLDPDRTAARRIVTYLASVLR